jgi:hypothetical protein
MKVEDHVKAADRDGCDGDERWKRTRGVQA